MRLVRLGAGGDPNWVNWVECAVVRAPLRVRGLSSSPALVHNNAGAPLAGGDGEEDPALLHPPGLWRTPAGKSPLPVVTLHERAPHSCPLQLDSISRHHDRMRLYGLVSYNASVGLRSVMGAAAPLVHVML